MTARKHELLLHFAFLILFLQLAISIVFFSKTNPDGGYWPFVLAIFGIVTAVYVIFVRWLVRSGQAGAVHSGISTLALAGCLFLLNNFAKLFGQDGHAMLVKFGLGGILESVLTPYLLYGIFAVIPFFTNLMPVRGSGGE